MSDLSEFAEQQRVESLTYALSDAKVKLRAAEKRNNFLSGENARLTKVLDEHTALKGLRLAPGTWPTPVRKSKRHKATAFLVLSDLHLGEVVDLAEMMGMNKYDTAIAEARVARVFNRTAEFIDNYISGVDIERIVVGLLGDIISGIIHEELERTNEMTVQETIVHWVPILAAGVTMLADHFGKVHVPCVEGNHDRSYKRIPYKQRARTSHGWLIYHWLADSLRHDKRVTFSISESPEQLMDVYSTRFLLAHGDAFRYDGGVGGIAVPMNKWLLRSHKLYSMMGKDFNYAVIGHWHSYTAGNDYVINGSLKGYDEYASGHKFAFEEPKQALIITTPEHGVTINTPIFALDRVKEGW